MISGFTLVELAIVLVIIGLLVGGALVGQSIIASSKISSQVSQLRGYDTAIAAFRLEYDAIPGDMKYADATAYGFSSRTSDNGNGIIDDISGNIPPLSAWTESVHVFTQLYQSKIINSRHSALTANSYSIGAGEPFPEDKIGRGGVALISKTDRKLYFFLGPTIRNNTAGLSNFYQNSAVPSFTPHESYQMDSKIDDGVPNGGKVRAVIVTSSVTTIFTDDTVTGATACLATTATYNLANESTPACRLTVQLGQ